MHKTFTLLALGAVAFAGCGEGPAYVADDDAALQLTLDEYRIQPENIRVRAGRVHLVARNAGRLTHNLVVQEFDPPPGEEPKEYARTDTAHPGETVSERHDLVLRPGKYRLVCSIANHDDLGQFGELKVTGP
jgi:uncharacterized cupredoxin-like copper-binding protein